MMHYTQVERKARLDVVREWVKTDKVNVVIRACIMRWGCSRRKAIEYIAEVTRE